MENIPKRPELAMPCTGCGQCCKEKVCKWGMTAFPGAEAPCPGLLWEGGRYWCLLVNLEGLKQGEKLIAKSLGIGMGCFKNANPKFCQENNQDDLLKLVLQINELATE